MIESKPTYLLFFSNCILCAFFLYLPWAFITVSAIDSNAIKPMEKVFDNNNNAESSSNHYCTFLLTIQLYDSGQFVNHSERLSLSLSHSLRLEQNEHRQ